MPDRARRLPHRPILSALALGLAALGLVPGAASAGETPITFNPDIGSCNTSGTGPPEETFRLIVRDEDGDTRYNQLVTPDNGGSWSIDCINGNIGIGYRFQAKVGGEVVRSFTVPRLIAQGNRDTDVAKGKAPSGTVTVTARDCLARGAVCLDTVEVRPVNAQGEWRWDLTGDFDARGGDEVVIAWTSPKGDVARTGTSFPLIEVLRGESFMYGTTGPNQTVVATLRRDGVNHAVGKGGEADERGYFSLGWRRNGSSVKVKLDDVVKADVAGGVSLRVRQTTISFGVDGQAISGTCFPDSSGVVYVNGSAFSLEGFTTDGDGAFTGTLDQAASNGDDWTLVCTTQAGDSLARSGKVALP